MRHLHFASSYCDNSKVITVIFQLNQLFIFKHFLSVYRETRRCRRIQKLSGVGDGDTKLYTFRVLTFFSFVARA